MNIINIIYGLNITLNVIISAAMLNNNNLNQWLNAAFPSIFQALLYVYKN
jgi:hypothetical protein